jgi:hypothetical protein
LRSCDRGKATINFAIKRVPWIVISILGLFFIFAQLFIGPKYIGGGVSEYSIGPLYIGVPLLIVGIIVSLVATKSKPQLAPPNVR